MRSRDIIPNRISLPQAHETALPPFSGEPFCCRYFYLRSHDTRACDDPGQDYLTFAHDDERFAFCLCDGVSQSFYGDLAARLLGDRLLEWLWGMPGAEGGGESLAADLTALLDDLRGPATAEVLKHPLPEGIPPMLKDVLEEKRSLGSETMFISGLVDLPSTEMPDGRVFFAWMGDSRVRAWLHERETGVELFYGFEMKQRWSTARGLVNGPVRTFNGALREGGGLLFDRFTAYSDGFSLFDESEGHLSEAQIVELMSTASTLPTNDDISYLEVIVKSGPEPGRNAVH